MNMNKLLIIDMQNDFITGSLGSKQAQEIVPNIVNKINSNKYQRIILTQDTHNKTDYFDTQEGKKLSVLHCESGTFGFEIHSDILNAIDKLKLPYDTTIINKHTFGTFDTAAFFEHRSDIIEICGVATDICVISNAIILKTIFSENQIIVDSKCCAGITPESHNAALQVMKMCQIEVI